MNHGVRPVSVPPPAACRGLLLACALLAAPACGGTIYKCTDAHGNVSYQDTPCAHKTDQTVLQMATPPPAEAPPPAQSAPEPRGPPPAKITAAAPPPAKTFQLPQLYDCINATNGKVYVSRNGHPAAYLVPLGMLGAFQPPLAQTYGGKNAARDAASDPQLAHGRITQKLVAGNYTRVQDRCRPLSPPEICANLRDQLDNLQDKIDKAFQDERPPLEQQAQTLRKEMAGCRR